MFLVSAFCNFKSDARVSQLTHRTSVIYTFTHVIHSRPRLSGTGQQQSRIPHDKRARNLQSPSCQFRDHIHSNKHFHSSRRHHDYTASLFTTLRSAVPSHGISSSPLLLSVSIPTASIRSRCVAIARSSATRHGSTGVARISRLSRESQSGRVQ